MHRRREVVVEALAPAGAIGNGSAESFPPHMLNVSFPGAARR
jgi:hypothetical protein